MKPKPARRSLTSSSTVFTNDSGCPGEGQDANGSAATNEFVGVASTAKRALVGLKCGLKLSPNPFPLRDLAGLTIRIRLTGTVSVLEQIWMETSRFRR